MRSLVSIEQQSPRRPCDNTSITNKGNESNITVVIAITHTISVTTVGIYKNNIIEIPICLFVSILTPLPLPSQLLSPLGANYQYYEQSEHLANKSTNKC